MFGWLKPKNTPQHTDKTTSDMPDSFEDGFEEILPELGEIAYVYVCDDEERVDKIYTCGTLQPTCRYQVFYSTKKAVFWLEDADKNLFIKDRNPAAKVAKLELEGIGVLEKLVNLHAAFDRECPTHIQLTYTPKTEEFTVNLFYEEDAERALSWFNTVATALPNGQ